MGKGKKGEAKKAKKPTTAEVAQRADKKANLALRQQETKFVYYDALITAVVNDASIGGNSIIMGQSIPTGTTVNQRDGFETVAKSVKGVWTMQRGTVDTCYRLLVVWDKEITVNPSSATFLRNVATIGVTMSDFNMENRGRYQVLYDTGPKAITSQDPYHTHKFNRKINKKVQYQANANVLVKGALRFIWYSDVSVAGVASAPILGYSLKYKFTG